MEESLGYFKGVWSGDCLALLLLSCLLYLGFFLSEIDPWVMVLLQLLKEVVASNHDFFPVERDAERVRSKSDFLDLALVIANKA